RGDLQGLGAASQALFGKAPSGLTRSESLLLAALLPAPSAPPERIVRRACALVQAGFAGTDCQAVRDLAFLHLNRRLAPYPENPALEALGAQLLREPGLVLRSSLDATLQREAAAALVAQLAQLHARHVDAGAVLVLDNASGEVRAYVANAGAVAESRFVDGIRALRQAGSTLKPFLYAQAFEKQYLTAASVLEDVPVALPAAGGIYAPQNYEKDFKGPVSARVALAGSLNVPAVRVLTLVGVEDFWTTLRATGFASLTEAPDFYGYALALGSADVTLWSLANAYRMLANRGLYSDAGFVPGEAHAAHRVFSPETAFLVADILADRGARAVTFDFENPLALPFRAAVKTGTSKDMRDNWCIGFSARHTVAVWVGNLDGAPMRDVSGITGAAPVWAAVMQHLDGQRFHAGDEAAPPAGLLRRRVSFSGLAEPAREEWFVAGTEMQRVDYVPNVATRILYPADDAVIAVDPDIPAPRQRVRFRAELAGAGGEWWLDGRRLGPAGNLDWLPVAGSHRLQLRDRAGNNLDSVRFIVRGRPGRR
ncbi:MAG: pbpC, partial [Moraxellaceae bacterium]|nr:pbpC [Moraxellaceae bacterium]